MSLEDLLKNGSKELLRDLKLLKDLKSFYMSNPKMTAEASDPRQLLSSLKLSEKLAIAAECFSCQL